jgi:hypothetical protein
MAGYADILNEQLRQAERHVAEGEKYLARQEWLIAELVRDGHSEQAEQARELLKQFEDLQRTLIADRDRLRKRLGT